MENIKNTIKKKKIIGIVRGVGIDKILKTVEALLEGGINLLEITLNQQDADKCQEALESMEIVKKEFKDSMYLGAGTVITEEQVERAVSVGAEYIISPHTDIQVITKTKELNKLSIPGASTPSEVVTAYYAGADFIKLFPAGNLGPDYVKAILGPLRNIPLVAVGGVNLDNVDQFIKAGVIGVGVGGSLVDKQMIQADQFKILKKKAEAFVKKLKE